MRQTGAARMQDVARLAGVSKITVSRVLSAPEKVSPKTREAVEAAIRETGYFPNLIAGGLASNRTRIIGVVVPTITNSIFADTIQGLSDMLEPAGYSIFLGQTGYISDHEQKLVAKMLGRRCDGLILIGASPSRQLQQMLRTANVPVVQTWDLVRKPIDLLVGFSHFEAGKTMTKHLIARGYRRIAFLGGGDPRSVNRGKGCAAACIEGGLEPPLHIPLSSPASIDAGSAALHQILEIRPRIDAAFFATDVFANGALLECIKLGISVPQQLAVGGFGDLEVARHLVPPLTTIVVPSYEMGRTAARLLLDAADGHRSEDGKVVDIGFQIKVRGST